MRRALPALAVAFCAGAALRLWVHIDVAAALFLLVVAALAFAGLATRERWGLVAALSLAAACGLFRTALWCEIPADSVAGLSDRRWSRLHGFVAAEPASRPWGVLVDLDVHRADTRRETLPVTGRVRVLIPPDSSPVPAYGDGMAVEGRVRMPDAAANPGEIAPAQYLRRDGVCAVLTADALSIGPARRANPVVVLALRAKAHMAEGIDRTLSPGRGALLKGLLFSDASALPDELRDAFARAGTVHILSTSGVHVAVLAGLVAVLWRSRRPRQRKWRALILLSALLLFGLMTGMRPAVTRAVVMTAIVLTAPLFDREPDVWCALALSALVLVAWSPGNLLDPGFQLSYAAVLALAAWFEGRRPAVDGPQWRRRFSNAMTVSVVAAAATSPLAALYFGVFSVASPLSNLLVVPAVGPAMALGLLQGALWTAWPVAASGAAFLNGFVLDWILKSTTVVAAWPFAAIETRSPRSGVIACLYILLGFALLARRRETLFAEPYRRQAVRGLAVASAGVAACLVWLATRPETLTVTFLDVGAADCAFIRTPGGRTVLVDAGGRPEGRRSGSDTGSRIVIPALRRAGVKRLDTVIVTHPHEDHAGGLSAVLRRFPTGMILTSGQTHDAPGYREAMRVARAGGVAVRTVGRGDVLQVEPGVWLEFLWPDGPPVRDSSDDLNNNSLVFRLHGPSGSVLFTGDVQREAEDRLLSTGDDLRADVLKVAHHGSRTSTAPDLVAATCPSLAIISTDQDERLGLPSEETLRTLEAAGVRVLRTDEDGGIVVRWSGGRPMAASGRWVLP